MESQQFDEFVSELTRSRSRRGVLRMLSAAIGVGATPLVAGTGVARRRRRRKKKGGSGGLALRQVCTPGQSTCAKGLRCDEPTTRQTCSSTVDGIDAWCCVPPGGRCTECDCCGDYYCEFDDNNNPTCQPNPEN